MSNKISVKNIIIIVAAALGAIGTFLPWATASVLGFSATATGADGGDGYITLILFVAAIVMAAITIKKSDMHIGLKIGISATAGIAALIGIIKIIDIMGQAMVSAGIGLWLIALAGVVAAVMPWIPMGGAAKKSTK